MRISPLDLVYKLARVPRGYAVASHTQFNEHADFYASQAQALVLGQCTGRVKVSSDVYAITFSTLLGKGPLELRIGSEWKGAAHSVILCLAEQNREIKLLVMRPHGGAITLLTRGTSLEIYPRREGVALVTPHFEEGSTASQRVLIFPEPVVMQGDAKTDLLLIYDTSLHGTTFFPLALSDPSDDSGTQLAIPFSVREKLRVRGIKLLP